MDRLLYLFADEPDVVCDDAMGGRALARFNGILKWKDGPATPGELLELHVTAQSGAERIVRDGFTIHPPPSPGVVSSWARTVPLTELGTHMVSWQLGRDRSGPIEVRVASAPLPAGPPLTIEPIPSIGIPHEPHLLARLVNTTDRAIDRASAFLDCAAILDGESRRLPAAPYDGAAELPPGASMWFLFTLDDFVPGPAPGVHDVRMRIAGHESAVVRLTI